MRYVDNRLLRKIVPDAIFEALRQASDAVEVLATDEEKRGYIEHNAEVYRALRPWLWIRGCCKCWYSEVKIQEGEGEVEHFRPKLRVWQTQPPHRGYTWLTFDWRNFRLAHPSVNKRRTDYSTGSMAGKGCYFPLREGSPRASAPGEEAQEDPLLLDPTVPQDCTLICFDVSSGKPVPRYGEDHGWVNRRAAASIEYYHLDDGSWNADRADLMRDVGILCDKIMEARAEHKPEYDDLVGELINYLDASAEFSAAAAQVVSEKDMWSEVHPPPGAPAEIRQDDGVSHAIGNPD